MTGAPFLAVHDTRHKKDDRTGECDDRFAAVVDALLDIGQMALRAQRSGPMPPDGVIQEELERLIRTIECYLDPTGPPSSNAEVPPPGHPEREPILNPSVVRRFADLPFEWKRYLIQVAPGLRFKVPKKMPRPSDGELRSRFCELQRTHVPCNRAYNLLADQSGRSWTRIRDIVGNRDERRRKRLKKSKS